MIRVFRHYIPRSLVVLGTSEALMLFGSVYLGISIRLEDFNPTDKLLVGPVWTKALLYTGVMMIIMAGMGLYQRGLRDEFRGLLFRICSAFLLGLIVMGIVFSLYPAYSTGGAAFALTFVSSAIGVVIFRALIHQYSEHDLFKRRVLILGAGRFAAQAEQLRRKTDRRDMMLVGYVNAPGSAPVVDASKRLQIETTLLDLARKHRVEEIVVALEEKEEFPVGQVLDCKMRGIRIIDLVTFIEQQTGRIQLDALDPQRIIFADGFIQAVVKSYVHRIFDLTICIVVLLIAWPLMLLAAVAIWLESGGRGPVLYKQTRVGRNGKPFEILKFRSMHPDAERDGVAQWAVNEDARVTRVGGIIRKFRIDELPQLLNVLKGDMSFVGPRPERPEFVEKLSETVPYYPLRHHVNPGITGWAQICYPYGASDHDAKEKHQYDLYYIKNFSLFLDLMILVQTAQVILWGKGAR